MSVGGSSLRNMSVSHWKLLSHLKEYMSKSSSSEKGVLFVLNKEWLSLLQKLHVIYSSVESGTQKTFDSNTPTVTKQISENKAPKSDTKKPAAKEDKGYSLPQVLTGFKLKKNSSLGAELSEEPVPKWKSSKESVSKISINSRTRHVIVSLASAETSQSRLKRLEDLASHLNQYPEARHLAIKEGVIRLLLQMRKEADETTLAVLRETLAVLGHVDPLPGRGIRILSIDGGGIRGVLVIELLKRLEELTGRQVYEMFDYICGVSTGAILLCVLVPQKKTLIELSEMYKELSTKIFTQSAFWGTSNLVWSHSYYDTEMWEQLLRKYVGETPLIKTARDPLMPKNNEEIAVAAYLREVSQHFLGKPLITSIRIARYPEDIQSGNFPLTNQTHYIVLICLTVLSVMCTDTNFAVMGLFNELSVISTVVNLPRVTAYVFRNYSLPYKVQSPYLGGSKYKLWEAVRASAAAPSYFEEYRLGELLHQDGGLLVNNPTAVALHEAKQLWPGYPIQCVVSFGTGRTKPVINGEDVNSSSWKTKFFKILDSATDTEGVHTMLNDLLPGNVYFRFNPYVTEMVTMDEIRPDKIGQLEQDAAMYYRRNEETFQEAAKALLQTSTLTQKVLNWMSFQREMLGIK